jgi:hypothetical protein
LAVSTVSYSITGAEVSSTVIPEGHAFGYAEPSWTSVPAVTASGCPPAIADPSLLYGLPPVMSRRAWYRLTCVPVTPLPVEIAMWMSSASYIDEPVGRHLSDLEPHVRLG